MKNLKVIRVAVLGLIVITLPLLSALGCSSKETPPPDTTSATGTSSLGSKGGAPDGSPPPKSPKQ